MKTSDLGQHGHDIDVKNAKAEIARLRDQVAKARVILDELLEQRVATDTVLKLMTLLGEPVLDLRTAYRSGSKILVHIPGGVSECFVSHMRVTQGVYDRANVSIELEGLILGYVKAVEVADAIDAKEDE